MKYLSYVLIVFTVANRGSEDNAAALASIPQLLVALACFEYLAKLINGRVAYGIFLLLCLLISFVIFYLNLRYINKNKNILLSLNKNMSPKWFAYSVIFISGFGLMLLLTFWF